MKNAKKKKIVVIGGGTGTYTVLSGLKSHTVDLTAVVSMADDGGSTGKLREEFGVLPPGDIRRALIALSSHPDKFLADLFSYRFREGCVSGHNFGNLILTALERVTGSFEGAIAAASKLLDVRGSVVPVTLSNVRLYAELENGQIIKGEANIDIPKHDGSLKIRRVWLKPRARANPQAIHAIKEADMIVIGPGDVFTSIIPNILVNGIRTAICKSRAKKVYITNLTTKYGETHRFSAQNFLSVFDRYLGRGVIDFIVVNTEKPSVSVLRRYHNKRADWVDYKELIKEKSGKRPIIIKAKLLRTGNLIRHDPQKLAKALIDIL